MGRQSGERGLQEWRLEAPLNMGEVWTGAKPREGAHAGSQERTQGSTRRVRLGLVRNRLVWHGGGKAETMERNRL